MSMNDLEACAADQEGTDWKSLGGGFVAAFDERGGMEIKGKWPDEVIRLNRDQVSRLREIALVATKA